MSQRIFWFLAAIAAVVLFGTVSPVSAAEEAVRRGAVTNLPLPRYVSLKVDEAFVRRGPSKTHRIDWVLTRRNMPLMITAEYENWRRVQDRDGVGGWVHYALLTGARTVLVEEDMLALHDRPQDNAPIAAQLQVGVIAKLGDCTVDWCHLEAGGYDGWAHKTALWGVDPDEIRE
ncbi:MAG: aspartyl-trna synthetase [Roseivivax sp.]|nr:aspartyl-trna synthetase [Roseivivax sp.]